eukprot:scaffold54933_cov17-Prasinocladus_malaysianus.AAC.1
MICRAAVGCVTAWAESIMKGCYEHLLLTDEEGLNDENVQNFLRQSCYLAVPAGWTLPSNSIFITDRQNALRVYYISVTSAQRTTLYVLIFCVAFVNVVIRRTGVSNS